MFSRRVAIKLLKFKHHKAEALPSLPKYYNTMLSYCLAIKIINKIAKFTFTPPFDCAISDAK
jgi:hypothetical protein